MTSALLREPFAGVAVDAIRHFMARAVFLRQKATRFLFQRVAWRMRHKRGGTSGSPLQVCEGATVVLA